MNQQQQFWDFLNNPDFPFAAFLGQQQPGGHPFGHPHPPPPPGAGEGHPPPPPPLNSHGPPPPCPPPPPRVGSDNEEDDPPVCTPPDDHHHPNGPPHEPCDPFDGHGPEFPPHGGHHHGQGHGHGSRRGRGGHRGGWNGRGGHHHGDHHDHHHRHHSPGGRGGRCGGRGWGNNWGGGYYPGGGPPPYEQYPGYAAHQQWSQHAPPPGPFGHPAFWPFMMRGAGYNPCAGGPCTDRGRSGNGGFDMSRLGEHIIQFVNNLAGNINDAVNASTGSGNDNYCGNTANAAAYSCDGLAAASATAKSNKKHATASGKDFTPDIDIFDHPDAYIVHVSLPGAKKEDVGVNWDADESSLTVAGVVYRPDANETLLNTLALDERKEVGVFERRVRLFGSHNNAGYEKEKAVEVDSDSIEAKMVDGVLVVSVPKINAPATSEVAETATEGGASSETTFAPGQPTVSSSPSSKEGTPEEFVEVKKVDIS